MTRGSPNRQVQNEQAESLPGIMTVPTHYLFKHDGSPQYLRQLLLQLGCNISKAGEKKMQITNENPRLMKLAKEAIRKHESGYNSGHLADLRTRQEHGEGGLAQLAMTYFDGRDIDKDLKKLRPVSLSEIGDFVGKMGMMRVGEAGAKIRTGGGFEIEECKKDLQKLHARIGTALAETVLNKHPEVRRPDRVKDKQNETKKKVFSLVRLPPRQEVHAEIVQSFSGKTFAEIVNILIEDYHVNSDVVITDPAVINAFAQIRALNRYMNQLVGIDTNMELAKMENAEVPYTRQVRSHKTSKRKGV